MRLRRPVVGHAPGDRLPRHRHATGYAAMVLCGGYVEAGDSGRFAVEQGDILFHQSFEAHRDWFGSARTELVDLPLDRCPHYARGRIEDADAVARLAERDLSAAVSYMLAAHVCDDRRMHDWPDQLADAILTGRIASLSAWADEVGVRPSSVSRGFRLAFGVSPQRFRYEARARNAARLVAGHGAALSAVAVDAGFADQAHMCRAVLAVTGSTPLQLRKDNCVQ